jgi:phosphoribosylformylglycinamidine synthase
MWPCKNAGEDARLYNAVKAASDFSIALGINIPTGKDSLSMTQKYNNEVVISPGTVIISAAAEVSDIKQIVEPVIVNDSSTSLLLIDLSRDNYKLGGSCLAQILNSVGNEAPTVQDSIYFQKAFNVIQSLIKEGKILAGHDISAGGLVTTLLEMCFANTSGGITVDLTKIDEKDTVKVLFSQNPGLIIQVKNEAEISEILLENGISYYSIGHPVNDRFLHIKNNKKSYSIDINKMRMKWFQSSYLLDRRQSGENSALERYLNFGGHEIKYKLGLFKGSFKSLGINPDRKRKSGVRAAIIREKGISGEREMAYALYLAGFDVKDVHTTDLISGREDLSDVNMIVFASGFSNSDVFGSAKGWTGTFKYNPKAAAALDNFFNRKDTLSLGICNGLQMMDLYPDHKDKPKLNHNNSNKFESGFVNVRIAENNSVMLGSLAGMELGVWVAHNEGRFSVPYPEKKYSIPIKYSRHTYPANPNGSDFDIAGLCSSNGRHLFMMTHLERSIFPWQCGYHPTDKREDDVTPWIMPFINAYDWIKSKVL